MGPPTCASGVMWPMQKPCEAPEKRPSVIRAHSEPRPAPMMAEVGFSISGMPGPPCGPSYLITTTLPCTPTCSWPPCRAACQPILQLSMATQGPENNHQHAQTWTRRLYCSSAWCGEPAQGCRLCILLQTCGGVHARACLRFRSKGQKPCPESATAGLPLKKVYLERGRIFCKLGKHGLLIVKTPCNALELQALLAGDFAHTTLRC